MDTPAGAALAGAAAHGEEQVIWQELWPVAVVHF